MSFLDCIAKIAMANIFPGDMLHKNFGITRRAALFSTTMMKFV